MSTTHAPVVFIGFSTRQSAGVEKCIPVYKTPVISKEAGRAEALAHRERFLADAHLSPYSGTFNEVVLIDRGEKKVRRFVHSVDALKKSVAVRVRNFFVSGYPGGWKDNDAEVVRQPLLIGFNVTLFLTMIGLECSLPENGKPAPARLWYRNTHTIDVGELVRPALCKSLNLKTIMQLRRPADAVAAVKYDALIQEWEGPGQNPRVDAELAMELSQQLGLLT